MLCKIAYMSSLKERIRSARLDAGFKTQASLAAAIGAERATVTMWESGSTKKIGGEYLLRLAQVLKKNPEWIQTGKGSPEAASVRETPHSYSLGSEGRHTSRTVLVPICRIPFRIGSNGGGLDPVETGDHVVYDRGWLESLVPPDSVDSLMMFIVGDSAMAPILNVGDAVLVAREEPSAIQSGIVYGLAVPGGAVFRRLFPQQDGSVHVCSDNENFASDDFEVANVSELALLGKAIQRTGGITAQAKRDHPGFSTGD